NEHSLAMLKDRSAGVKG
ncbi:hypothetical protein ACMTAU_16290, partial [Alcaligenes pakistanensis]